MSKTLAACIVRVCSEDGQTFGTGFVIGSGRAMTCAHVVEGAGGEPGGRVFIIFAHGKEKRPALVNRALWRHSDEEDIAVLEFKGRLPRGVRPARVTTSGGSKDSIVESFGFPNVGEVEGVWAQGRMAGETVERGIRLLQLDSKVITSGFSGGPVWRTDTGQVIGMVTSFMPSAGTSTPRDVAYAIPSELLPGVPLERLRPRMPVWWIGVSTSVVVGLVVVLSLYLLLGLGSFGPPAVTAPPPSTVAPTLTPTPLPPLDVYDALALQNVGIHEVAAAEGHVWFGTDNGLFHYYEPSNAAPVLVVPNVSISAMAVDDTGTTVWFSRTTGDPIPASEGLVGRYTLTTEGEPTRPAEWWVPEGEFFEIVSIQLGDSGAVWVGGQNGEVFRLSLTGAQLTWTPFSLQSGLYDMNLDPRDDSIVWVAGSTAVYELREGQWKTHGQEDLGLDPQATVMNAVTVDGAGRVWIGHASGLTLLWNRQPGGKTVVPCSLDTVFDAAATSNTDALWFVTRNNLERLDLTSGLDVCTTWGLVPWADNLFWSGASPADYRLAIDEPTAASSVTIWAIRRGTDQVRVLKWR